MVLLLDFDFLVETATTELVVYAASLVVCPLERDRFLELWVFVRAGLLAHMATDGWSLVYS
jgi:hypothetical protein